MVSARGLGEAHFSSFCFFFSLQRIKRAVLTAFNVGQKDPSSLGKLSDKDRVDIKGMLMLNAL